MNYNQDSSPIKFTPGRDSNYRSNSEVGTRPTGDPKSRKDFKKVLQQPQEKDEDEQQPVDNSIDEGPVGFIGVEDTASKKRAPSLFDLTSSSKASSTSSTALPTQPVNALAAREALNSARLEQTVESPSNLYAKLSNTSKKQSPVSSTASSETTFESAEGMIPSIQPDKEKFTTRYATEQPDLSYVNPMSLTINKPMEMHEVKAEKPLLPLSHIQDIINQLVDKIQEIKDQGKTETIVSLKHPPLFAGANLVVTSYDSARGEFNIAFEGLTQQAKNLLDMGANQESLRLALEQKGYAVHIMTTTTLVENAPIIGAPPPSRDQADREREREGGQREGRRGREGTA